MKRRSRHNAFTPLAAIKPPVEGRSALLVHAARRWRRLAGPALARRLPLLEVKEDGWVIGLPAGMWQSELDRLARQEAESGRSLPPLLGRILTDERPASQPMTTASQEAPPPGAGAPQRLRWLMEQLSGKEGD